MRTLERIARSELSTILLAMTFMIGPASLIYLLTPAGSVTATCSGGMVTIVLACLWRRWQAPVLQENQPQKAHLNTLLVITLLTSSAFLIAMATNTLAQSIESTHTEETEKALNNTPLALIVLTVIIIAPIAEELVFRGMIHNQLRGRSMVLATISSATLFGLSHGNITQIIGGIMLGLVLSCVYEMTGTLIGSIAAHIGYNFFVLFAPGFGESTILTTIILGLAGAATITSVVYLLNAKKNLPPVG